MRKILFIHHARGWGGAPMNMMNIINSLDRKKYEPLVLLIRDSVVGEKLKENGIKYTVAKSKFYQKYYSYYNHTVPGFLRWYQFYKCFTYTMSWFLSRYYYASRELDNLEFDMVQLNSSVLTDWLAPCKNKGKVAINIQEPVSRGYLGIRHSFFRFQMKKYADIIIAISQDNAKRIGLHDKTEIIHNYADILKIKPKEDSYASKKFLYLGGSAQIKGFYTLVSALEYLDNDIKIYFGGNYGTLTKKRSIFKRVVRWLFWFGVKKEKIISKMRIHPRAVEIGLTHNVNKYLEEVCCLISPFSVPHFSRPVIEAHLHKKPAIGSDVEGMDEIIEHEKNGLIFKNDNTVELAKAVNYMARHPKEAERMGKVGYQVAIKKFTADNIQHYQEIYNNL